ncbi:MAG: hypothetical protein CMA63_04570 [Euryarchaeota archaeon]|nr:hypothetical protein [Euryarchaeota archaeon]|tara:strand:- start:32366 stop:32725 length:360 start_codon:yes stop_codon:yes gene_type:complete
MSVKVGLERYTVMAKHGYYPHEHEQDQPFVFTVWATLEHGIINELDQTLNYADLQTVIDEVMFNSSSPIALMESMAQRIIEALKDNLRLASLHVRIEKPEAPLPHEGGLAVVEVEWQRN